MDIIEKEYNRRFKEDVEIGALKFYNAMRKFLYVGYLSDLKKTKSSAFPFAIELDIDNAHKNEFSKVIEFLNKFEGLDVRKSSSKKEHIMIYLPKKIKVLGRY